MLSAEDYDAELAERYGWINRALPAGSLGDFVSSLAHRIARFPTAVIITCSGAIRSTSTWRNARRTRTVVFPVVGEDS